MESIVGYTAKFEEYHLNNPQVFEAFKKYSKELVDAGIKVGSANSVLHRLRWEAEINAIADDYKFNQNYAVEYAVMAMLVGAVPMGFFKLKSKWSNVLKEKLNDTI